MNDNSTNNYGGIITFAYWLVLGIIIAIGGNTLVNHFNYFQPVLTKPEYCSTAPAPERFPAPKEWWLPPLANYKFYPDLKARNMWLLKE